MLTIAPKGTKDMLPSEAYKWHFIEKAFADVCQKYGFKEIRTPIFEHTELFVRGVGDTTDIVQKEMYTWEQAKRSLTLRPEGTSAVVRAIGEHKIYADPQPTKLYYNIPCFRYEKPQSGRLRQFHQFGVEVFGTNNMMADAEVIALAYDFINGLGIKDVELQINSIGCPNCREAHRAALREFLKPNLEEFCDTCKDRYDRNPLRMLDCKSPVCQELVKGAPTMLDYLCDDCKTAFEDLKSNLTALEIEFVVNPGIVRGLDYYNATAFEFVTNSIGAQGTICGGGRYDNLSESIGGPPIPGVGFGLGKERLLLVLEANGIEIPNEEGINTLVAFMGDKPKHAALKLVKELRAANINVEIDCLARNLKGQFKYADRLGAKNTIVIGENELEDGKVTIKKMETSEQVIVDFKLENIIEEIRK
ncbi:MAG: histidine--tRNA ligase [Anaerovoracaceae bacterium]